MSKRSAILLAVAASVVVSGVFALAAFGILRGMDAEIERLEALSEIADKTRALHILTASDTEGSVQADLHQVQALLQSLNVLLRDSATTCSPRRSG